MGFELKWQGLNIKWAINRYCNRNNFTLILAA
jgi:hypothetical protein